MKPDRRKFAQLENRIKSLESENLSLRKSLDVLRASSNGTQKKIFGNLLVKPKVAIYAARITRNLLSLLPVSGNSKSNFGSIDHMVENRSRVLGADWHTKKKRAGECRQSISISIVTYNNSCDLPVFFESLLRTSYDKELISIYFQDNDSSDDTVEVIKQFINMHSTCFKVIQLTAGENVGFGCGHDKNISNINDEYFLVTNVDMEFEESSIDSVVRAATIDAENVACWELRQFPFEHPKYYDPVSLETNWCSHACILMRKSAYDAVGGYDKKLFMYGEDVELSYRFRYYDYILRYVPEAVVYHDTYSVAWEFKPLQYKGSMLANALIRARYGNIGDAIFGVINLFKIYIKADEQEKYLAKNAINEYFLKMRFFWVDRKYIRGKFPFRVNDYEMIRDGAFYFNALPESMPLVTVITRTMGNRTQYLQQAIVSVINQTYKNVEHVIVQDDGDSSKELIQLVAVKYPGINIKFYTNPSKGRSSAANYGINKAAGELLIILDDDDLLYPEHIEVLVSNIEKDPNTIPYTFAWEVKTEKRPDGIGYREHSHDISSYFRRDFSKSRLMRENFIPIQSALFWREDALKVGCIDEDIDVLEDWNFWVKMSHIRDFKLVDKLTSLYRVPGNSEAVLARKKTFDESYSAVKKKNDAIAEKFQVEQW